MNDADETLALLVRILRRYADSSVGVRLSSHLAELARGEMEALPAFEAGSDERIVETVMVGIHQKLALLVDALHLEMGSARLDAAEWADGLDPDDFSGPEW